MLRPLRRSEPPIPSPRFAAGMGPTMSWWRRKKKSLRQQLTEARASVQRELDITDAGPIKLPWQPGTAEKLRARLAEIDQQLGELDPDDT
jgi:hypothetical protein